MWRADGGVLLLRLSLPRLDESAVGADIFNSFYSELANSYAIACETLCSAGIDFEGTVNRRLTFSVGYELSPDALGKRMRKKYKDKIVVLRKAGVIHRGSQNLSVDVFDPDRGVFLK